MPGSSLACFMYKGLSFEQCLVFHADHCTLLPYIITFTGREGTVPFVCITRYLFKPFPEQQEVVAGQRGLLKHKLKIFQRIILHSNTTIVTIVATLQHGTQSDLFLFQIFPALFNALNSPGVIVALGLHSFLFHETKNLLIYSTQLVDNLVELFAETYRITL